MACGLVAMDEALIGDLVDLRHRCFVFSRCGILVATAYRAEHLFDLGAHSGAQRHIVAAALNGLTGALASRLNIGQGISSICPGIVPRGAEKRAILRARHTQVKVDSPAYERSPRT